MKKGVMIFFLFLLVVLNYTMPVEIVNSKFEYLVDIPEDWSILDSENPAIVTFSDKTKNAVFQVFTLKKGAFSDTNSAVEYLKKSFNPLIEYDNFNFNGLSSLFASLSFKTKNFDVQGFSVVIIGGSYDFVLLAVANKDFYEKFKDQLFSCLDSFAVSEKDRLSSGPVSQYYYKKGNSRSSVKFYILSDELTFDYSIEELDAAKIVIEREARILSSVKDSYYYAWERYYRIIYRDNYKRIKSLSDQIKAKSVPDIISLINWMQMFGYSRTNTTSDFTSPVELVVSKKGDCDSRVILLNIILNQLGIDSIIAVSVIYKHALIGIDMPGNGKRITFNKKSYLLVELTKKSIPGVIDETISNLEYWFPIKVW